MSRQRARLGPATEVPYYGPKAWRRWGADVKTDEVWQLCAPTVMKHMDNHPLWKVFCILYYEGLVHGREATLAAQTPGPQLSVEWVPSC